MHQSPSSPRGMTGAPRSSTPTTSCWMPGPERIWMLLAATRKFSMKSLLSQTSNRSGGEMAAQSPSTRATNRISPEWAEPKGWAAADGRAKRGAEGADTCMRVWALAERAASANPARGSKPERRKTFMGAV